MNTTQVSVDVAKSVFQVAVSHTPGRVHKRHRLSRGGFVRFFAGHEPVEVLMEACASAHYWGRELEAMGHHVSLLPPTDVSRYRDGSKTDRADAKALLEAARNRAIDRVPVKSVEQQALTALHRLRSGYIATRTARINAVRGHLREFGVSIPLGAARVIPCARAALDGDAVPELLHAALLGALEEIEALSRKADSIHKQLTALARHMPAAQQLMTVPGIGVLTATALVAFVGDVGRFRSGRHFAAYLGLTPREHSSGRSRRLGRITKHGNSYLRTLIIHGARSALRAGQASQEPDELRRWALQIKARKGYNLAAVALANKLARICWRVWRDDRPFEVQPAA
jgi:transposase